MASKLINKQKRKVSQNNKQAKKSRVEKANEILAQLSPEEFLQLSGESRRKARDLVRGLENRAFIEAYLKEERVKWLEKLTGRMIESLYFGVEWLLKRINPWLRGQVGDVLFYVHEDDIFSLLKLADEDEIEGWEILCESRDLIALPWTKDVDHIKFQTDDMNVLRPFLQSFNFDNTTDILEQHWLTKTSSEVALPIRINVKEMEGKDCDEIRKMINQKSQQAGWFPLPTCIKSSVICLGDYTAPGTLTSLCVLKEAVESKTNFETDPLYRAEAIKEKEEDRDKPKEDRKRRRAKFIIEIKRNAFPKSGMAIVRFSCKYEVLVNGMKEGN